MTFAFSQIVELTLTPVVTRQKLKLSFNWGEMVTPSKVFSISIIWHQNVKMTVIVAVCIPMCK